MEGWHRRCLIEASASRHGGLAPRSRPVPRDIGGCHARSPIHLVNMQSFNLQSAICNPSNLNRHCSQYEICNAAALQTKHFNM
eukprot:8714232-Alexandrium_andersonii.AAC.1